MNRFLASLLPLLISAAMAAKIEWNNGQMCMDVNGFEPASAPQKHVQLRHCSGNGNQQFYQDGQGNIRWQQNGWCLGADTYGKLIAGPSCSPWGLKCFSHNNCNYELNGNCITTPGTQDPSIQGYAFDLQMGGCSGNGNFFSPPTAAKTNKTSVQVKAEGGCPCYYDGRVHNCNKSPFPNDDRCVCGAGQGDWKTPAQCQAPGPQPTPPIQGCNANGYRQDCGWRGVNEQQCEAKGCCWMPAGAGSADPWCFYHNGESSVASGQKIQVNSTGTLVV